MNAKFFDYNQEAMAEYHVSLDEAWLLRYLKQFFHSGYAEKRTVDGIDYFKIYISKIKNDNSALQVSDSGIRKMIARLEEKGFIKKYKHDINSSTMYMRVCDRPLTYTKSVTRIEGKDKLLKIFIKAKWQINKNAKAVIELSSDDVEGRKLEFFDYSNTYLSTSIINLNLDLFKQYLCYYLKQSLSTSVYNLINDIDIMHNKVRLSTISKETFQDVLKENCYNIESAICMAYMRIFEKI